MAGSSAIARRLAGDARVVSASFAFVFTAMAYANAAGYRHSYPTLAGREQLARTFGANRAVQLFYGRPHDLLTVGGYSAWRLAGFGSILAAVWAVFAVVRALRGEEDAGRQELVLAAPIGRRRAYAAALAGVAVGGALLWSATFAALVAGALPAGGSAFLALATVAAAAPFAGVAAVACQVAGTRRGALQLALSALGVAYLLRVVADIAGGAAALRWATPLGWVEELRPFADPDPRPILLLAALGGALAWAASAVAGGRDVGIGLIRVRDTAPPRVRLLASAQGEAVRAERGAFVAWAAGTAAFALTVGLLSTAFTSASISPNLQQTLERLGGTVVTTPAGALGFYFVFFVLVISLYACSQVASSRREEADQRLELLLALPVSRTRWLTGRILLAGAGASVLALVAAAAAWVGAAAERAHVGPLRLLEAGVNCLPAATCFLGIAVLAFGVRPRAAGGVAYGVVTAAFLWQLFGSIVAAPRWLLDVSPFRHVAPVPAAAFDPVSALGLVAVGLLAGATGCVAFARRDLASA